MKKLCLYIFLLVSFNAAAQTFSSVVIQNGPYEITEFIVDISPYQVESPNSVLGYADIILLNNDQYLLAFQEEHDVVLVALDLELNIIGEPLVLENYWYSDMEPASENGFYIALGRDENNTYIETYPNTLYIIKYDSEFNILYTTYIFGGEGHGPGLSWFDGRSRAELTVNGSEVAIYFEVQKNWAEDYGEDIHNGDMFVALNTRGRIKENLTHFWTASHSSTIQTATGSDGNYYTMTIGDAFPYGLQLYNRNINNDWLLWPPDEDYIPYSDVNSTNAAGILEEMYPVDGGFIAMLGTTEHPNIGWETKVDVLFLRTSLTGDIQYFKWLSRSAEEDDAVISFIPLGDNFLVGWGKGNDYNEYWEPGNVTLSLIDEYGEFILNPISFDISYGTYSKIIKGNNGSAVWIYVENYDSEIKIYQLEMNY